MARSYLARILRTLQRNARQAHLTKAPVSEVLGLEAERRLARRRFLAESAKAGLVAAGVLGGLDASRALGAPQGGPSVVIVGAGLAGLTCAYRLKRRGILANVYEAASRLGGRCLTRRGFFADGQLVERGGELIDTGHTAIRHLARQLGLEMDDVLAAEPEGTEPIFQFGGARYTFEQATTDFLDIFPALDADVRASGYPTTYDASTPRGRELDAMSVADYIDEVVPGGHGSPLGQLLDVAYNIEFGAEASDQSALNLLYLLGYSSPRAFQIFGESDERFHIRGGNDQVVSRLADELSGQVQVGHELVAVGQGTDGRACATFATPGGTRVVKADHLVLALPFSILRRSVNLSGSGLSSLKRTAINELGFGSNSKLQLQFRCRHWEALGCNGDTYSDTGYQNTWEVTRGQAGRSGILNNFTGGDISLAQGRPLAQLVPEFLARLEPVLPGITAKYNGRATIDHWDSNPWSRGSYAYWRVGQYTQFAGYEGVQEGNIHFCGEHTSIDYQGYLNGAIDTGNAVARDVCAQL